MERRRTFQVEFLSRPDEREHIVQHVDFRLACNLAREMSDKYDGSAVVVALDHREDGNGLEATGHIEFVFGITREKIGVLKDVDVPRAPIVW